MSNGFLKTNGINHGVLSADPSGGQKGDSYFNDVSNQFKGYNGSSWVPIGGSGSGLGINFIGNAIADSTDGYELYDDGAVAVPIDGDGGAPSTLTFTRNTSSPIHGDADFKLSKSAADGQGEGLAYEFTAGTGFPAGTRCLYSFYSKGSANFVTGANSDLQMYLYDVTNSRLITPSRTGIFLNGYNVARFDLTSGTTYRALLHVATTSALAWDFQFKFLSVGPGTQLAQGPILSDFKLDTDITISASFGTVTAQEIYSRRVGDCKEVFGSFVAGTTTGVIATFGLPVEIDPDKINSSSNGQIVGSLFSASSDDFNAGGGAGVTRGEYTLFYDGSDTDTIYMCRTPSTPGLLKDFANQFAPNSGIQIYFKVPIKGWTTENVVAQSGILRASDLLASGTRVTATPPTALGEYRSYLRDAAAITYNETNGSPGTAPSSADGILIYGGNGYAAADSNNEPSRYDIFIGYNKSYRINTYATTGRTGDASRELFPFTDSVGYGFTDSYDPTTGILTVWLPIFSGTVTSQAAAYSPSATITDAYFDVLISDNDYQIQMATERNEVWLTTGNTHGSTNTHIRRFSNIKSNMGSSIIYADSVADGASFLITTPGLYWIGYNDNYSAASIGYHGVSLNSNQLTTSIQSITDAHRLVYAQTDFDYNGGGEATTVVYLNKGDIIRPHDDGNSNDGGTLSQFKIVRLS